MPKIGGEGKEMEGLAVERRVKSFSLKNLSYKSAFKSVGRDTLIVLTAVSLLLGVRRLYRVLFKGEDFKSAFRGYL